MAVEWVKLLTSNNASFQNLATQDLTCADAPDATFERSFTLPAAATSSALVFKGHMSHGGFANTVRPLLRIESDSDSTSSDRNYVYASSLKIGNVSSLVNHGTQGTYGYGLPQFDPNDDGAKVLVTTSDWTTLTGDTEFKSIEDVLGPDGDWVDGTFTDDSLLAADDSLVVYRNGAEEFKHLKLKHFPRSYYLQVGRNGTLGNGSFWMRGVNGIELNNEDFNIGLVVAEDCNLVRLTAGWRKYSGGTSHQRQVKIWVNGTYIARTAYMGSGIENLAYITEAFTTFVLPNNQTVVNSLPLNAGDTISFQYYNAGSYPGQGTHFQVNALLNTVTD